MGKPHRWTPEQDAWLIENVCKGIRKSKVESMFEAEFGRYMTYSAMYYRRMKLTNPSKYKGINNRRNELAKERTRLSRAESAKVMADGEKAPPTAGQEAEAARILSLFCPCCASFAREMLRTYTDYDWDFDQTRKLAKDNGLEITRLEGFGFNTRIRSSEEIGCVSCGRMFKPPKSDPTTLCPACRVRARSKEEINASR